jgi:hypothetical protein
MELKYKTDALVPERRQLPIILFKDIFSAKTDRPGSRAVKGTQQMHQRAFAGTGRANQGGCRAGLNIKIDPAKDFKPV